MTVKYAGKIIDGKPLLLEPVALPENADITIVVEWPTESKTETLTPTRQAAAQFLAAVQELRKKLTDEDKAALDELESGKYKLQFDRRLDV